MGVVRREGKWTLEKEKKGLYAICKRDRKVAEIITDEYTSSNNPFEISDPMMKTIEAGNFKDAVNAFKDYINRADKSGGFGLL